MDPLDLILAKLSYAVSASGRYFENDLVMLALVAVVVLVSLTIVHQKR